MEIRFDRDLRHNYMVLCGLETTGDYRLRMLSENCPPGLLPCSLRNINGAGYLYYEIDSRQPMRNRYADGGLTAEDLRRLLRAVDALRETLEDYLLDAEHVLFSADCVYTDVRTGGFYFVYCPFPWTEQDGTSDFAAFSEELLAFLDEGDEEAARIAYALCEMAGRGEMLLRDIVQAALEEAKGPTLPTRVEAEGDLSEDVIDEVFRPRAPRDEAAYPREEQKTPPVAEDEGEKGSGRKKRTSAGVFAALFAAVFVGNLVIRSKFYLNARENLLSYAAAGMSLLMTVVSLVWWMKGGKEDAQEKEEDDGEDGWIRAEQREAEIYGDFAADRMENRRDDHMSRRTFKTYDPQEEPDEETTVLNEDEVPFARKLYGRNDGKTINISLERLPLTVGKLSGCADFVIRDPSVSRMHTRFFGDGAGAATQMKDLNSTNGTFLNGRRLRPNETVSIRPGDEIGIGRLLFELR